MDKDVTIWHANRIVYQFANEYKPSWYRESSVLRWLIFFAKTSIFAFCDGCIMEGEVEWEKWIRNTSFRGRYLHWKLKAFSLKLGEIMDF